MIIKRDASELMLNKKSGNLKEEFKNRERLNAFPVPMPTQKRRSGSQ
jgi:hypothetical protein